MAARTASDKSEPAPALTTRSNSSIDPFALKRALGVFVLIFAVYQTLPLPDLRGSRIWAFPAGLLGGLVGTIFGTGGPFYMIYLSLRGLGKTETRASFASYFFIDGSIRLIGFLLIGMLNKELFIALIVLLPAAAIGLLVGGRVHTEISNNTCLLYTSPSPRDGLLSRMPSSA